VNYTLRQDAGDANSLGQIRIDMPNRHAVYMHDTPTKRLFSGEARFHSSGCVRVAEVKTFVTWLLEGTPGPTGAWAEPDLDAAIAGAKRQDVRLAKPVPVAWVYLTGYATLDGTVHFRDDIYGLDALSPPAPQSPEPLDVPVTASITPRRLN
jgi:L,D-transpeptidase YcbB